MTTATRTWPTADELALVEQKVVDATNALDELAITYSRIASAIDAYEEGSLPTFEELGRLSRFVSCVEQDLMTMQQHLEPIREAHHAAALRMS